MPRHLSIEEALGEHGDEDAFDHQADNGLNGSHHDLGFTQRKGIGEDPPVKGGHAECLLGKSTTHTTPHSADLFVYER